MRFAKLPCAAAVLVVSLATSTRVGGQSAPDARAFSVGAMAIGVATRADPAYLGASRTEGYFTQPNAMVDARRGPFELLGTFNFEGYTLRRGELNAGMYGEGYVDRRHPHTFVHEAMLSMSSPRERAVSASLAAGKGFTPYGTDDPMMRALISYPVNHHHAQIIERAQVIGAVRLRSGVRDIVLEHARFNGDEPYAPFSAPQWSRVGDSRTTRLTVHPLRGLELQGSGAFVKSPGLIQGGAFDHVQRSASVRVDRPNARGESRRLLVEFARTDESLRGRRVFRFESVLAEGMASHRGWQMALRVERTERPENERLLDPFRTANGHVDFQIIGVTQWKIATVQLATPPVAPVRFAHASAFVELSRAHAAARRFPAVFDPASFYGNASQLSISVGARLHLGTMRSRMGRYGVLAEPFQPTDSRHMAH